VTIKFNALHRSLMDDERLRPKPVGNVMPEWKREIDVKVVKEIDTGRSARACPALDDYLHLGYVIPLWTDIRLTRITIDQQGRVTPDPNGTRIHWKVAAGAPPLEMHTLDQVKGAEPLEPPFNINDIIKPLCPWFVETPPGWSILILPLVMHEKRKKIPLQPIPGVVNTDHWHQINTPCFWENVEPIMDLKAGTPFMHVIPFRRNESLKPEFGVIDTQLEWDQLKGFLNDFDGGYRRQQKNADKARAKQ
jgi:hypothetical protein